jgi:hypothetical protein
MVAEFPMRMAEKVATLLPLLDNLADEELVVSIITPFTTEYAYWTGVPFSLMESVSPDCVCPKEGAAIDCARRISYASLAIMYRPSSCTLVD